MVDSHGYITTVAAGTLINPVGVALDQAGILYISDAGNSDVLSVDLSGNVSIIAGMAGNSGSGCGSSNGFSNATSLGPVGQLVSDAAGDVMFLNNNPSSNYVCEIGRGFGSRSYTYHAAAGQSSTTQTSLYNNGNLGMTLSGISFTGSSAFSQTTASSPSCGVGTSLPVGSSCNFNVQFTAPAVQKSAYTGTLTLTDGAYNSPQKFTLTGYSVGAESQLAFTNAPYNSFTLGASGLTVSVQIQDSNGNAVPSSDSITLTVTFPDNSTQTRTQTTGSGGAVSFSLPASMFTQAGQYSLQASDTTNTGVTPTSSASFTVNPKPNSFQVSAPSSVTAGSQFSFTVTATQWNGTTATTWAGYTGTVSFGLSGSAAGANLPGSYTFQTSDGGVHTFTATLNTAGTATLMVSDSNGDAGSAKITVNPGVVNRLRVSNQTSVTGGVPFFVTVTAQDSWGNTVTGYTGTVHFSSDDSLAVLPANSTLSNGTGAFSVTLNSPGIHYIIVTDAVNSLQEISGSIAVAGSVQISTNTSLVLSTSSAIPGQVVTLTATVTQNGLPVTAGAVTFWQNQTPLSTVQLVGSPATNNPKLGTATLNMAFPANSYGYPIGATYNGTQSIAPSVANYQQLNVTASTIPTTTTLANPILGTNGYNFTATVTASGAEQLSGQVNLQDQTTSTTLGNFSVFAGPGYLAQQTTSLGTGTSPDGIVTADFNGDGINDVAVVDTVNKQVLVMLGQPSNPGQFSAPVAYPVGNSPVAIAVGDFNGDGLPDLAVTNSADGTVTVLLNNFTNPGTFTPSSPYTVGSQPAGIAAADLNGDGILDLVVANKGDGTVSVLLGDATNRGQFLTQTAYPAGQSAPIAVAVSDFNGDGVPDLAVVNNTTAGAVSILLATTPGQFSSSTVSYSYSVGTSPIGIVVADFNGDGFADIAVTNQLDNTVSLLLGSATNRGQFVAQTPITVGKAPMGIAAFNSNGGYTPNLAVVNNSDGTVSVLTNQSQVSQPQTPGVFTQPTTYTVGNGPVGIAAADLNSDGLIDLVVSNSTDSTISMLAGDMQGTANFWNISIGASGGSSHLIQASFQPNSGSSYTSSVSNTQKCYPPADNVTTCPSFQPCRVYLRGFSFDQRVHHATEWSAYTNGYLRLLNRHNPAGYPVPLVGGCAQLQLEQLPSRRPHNQCEL